MTQDSDEAPRVETWLAMLSSLQQGLLPYRFPDGTLRLLIKATKEVALTAKMRMGFKVYVVPGTIDGSNAIGIVTAFFDDDDEPLVLKSALMSPDTHTAACLELLQRRQFDVHFFDEHDRELLSFRCENPSATRFDLWQATMRFPQANLDRAVPIMAAMETWFGLRTASDDQAALIISLRAPVAPLGIELTFIERTDPGPAQEADIAGLLRRCFPASEVLLNPQRTDRALEFADIVVVGDDHAIIVQAKDSPNTAASLSRSLERKRSTVVQQVEKASAQLAGSISKVRSGLPIAVHCEGREVKIELSGKILRGLVVVKETFDADVLRYAKVLTSLASQTGVPSVLMDYSQLHAVTANRATPHGLLEVLDLMAQIAADRGVFPRIRYGLVV